MKRVLILCSVTWRQLLRSQMAADEPRRPDW